MVVWTLVCVMICRYNTAAVVLTALLVFGICTLLAKWMQAMERCFENWWFWPFFWMVALIFFALVLTFVLDARIELPSDTYIVYDSVADLLRDGKVNEENPQLASYYPQMKLYTNSDYFCMYPNNIALLTLLAGAYWLVGGIWEPGTIEGQTPALFLSAAAAVATVLIVCWIAYRLTEKKTIALFVLLAGMCFPSFYYNSVNFYTDTFVLPLATGASAMLINYFLTRKEKWVVFAGLCFSAAVCMKVTAGVIVIAGAVAILFVPGTVAHRCRRLLLFAAPLAAGMMAFQLWTKAKN